MEEIKEQEIEEQEIEDIEALKVEQIVEGDIEAVEQTIEEVNEPIPVKKAVGGWLLILILTLAILKPIIEIFTLNALGKQFDFLSIELPWYKTYFMAISACAILFILFGIFAGVSLWTMKNNAVRITKIYLGAYLVCTFSIYLILFLITPSVGEYKQIVGSMTMTQLVKVSVYCGVLYAFLINSEDIKDRCSIPTTEE